jgi:tRNA A-37 threonylcarbamoyl transferase component Bud32
MTVRAREGGRGNRIWRVRTPGGVVLQKLYRERGGRLHALVRETGSRLRGGKSSTRAAGRRATEARLLALWSAAGCDVPADLSARHPGLAREDTLVLEHVDGRLLSERLADDAEPEEARRALLAAWARDLGRRHGLALERREAALVHEHGGAQHVLVADGRLVTFDLENAFLPRADLVPLVAKEIAAALRSLARAAPGRFDAWLSAFADAYGRPDLLAAAVRHYLHPTGTVWRLAWWLDRLRERRRAREAGKFRVLEALERHLAAGAPPAGPGDAAAS